MEEILVLANKLGGASFATLLLLILWGSWKEIWVWGRAVTRLTERYETLLSKQVQETEFWRTVALRVTGVTDTLANKATKAE